MKSFELYENAPDMFLSIDVKSGNIIYCNQTTANQLGYTKKQIIGKSIFNFYHPDCIDDAMKAFQYLKTSGKVNDAELKIVRNDGSVLDISLNASAIRDEKGNIIQSSSVWRNITSRKQDEQKLKNAYQLMVDILESMSDAFVSLDKEWKYIYMNKRAGEIFNRKPEDMIGKHIWSEFPEGVGQPFQLAYQKAMTEQTFIQLEEYYAPYDKWFENRIYPFDKGISIFFTDTTDRKKIEVQLLNANRKLKEQEEQLLLFVEHSPAPVAMFDKEMKYLVASQSWINDYNLQESNIIGLSHYDVFPDLPERWKEIHLRCLNGAIEKCDEDPFPHADGSIDWIHWEIRPWKDRNNNIGGIIIFSEVITARKKNEQDLVESKLRLELAIKASNTGLWDWDLTTNKVFFSPEWKKQIGYEEWEIPNDFSEWEKRVHPDDLQIVLTKVNSFIKDPWANFENEFRFRHKDGSYRWILAKASVIQNENGSPIRMLGSHLDITDRKKAELDVLIERNFSDSLLDSLPGIFYFFDDKRKFIKWNKNFETVSGYSHSEIAKMDPLDFFIGSDKNYIAERIGLVFENGESDAETNFALKNGTTLPYYFTGKRIEVDGKPCLLGMGIDIAERKKAEKNIRSLMNRLIESEEMMRKNAAQQLHDQVGQNLTALTINLNYLITQLSEDSLTKMSNRLNDSLSILNETVEQIRNIMIELRPSVLDDYGLNAALNLSINKFSQRTNSSVKYNGKDLSKRLPINIEYTLFLVVQEALHNISKHAAAKNIIVTLEEMDNVINLKVVDDGIGFDSDKIKKIEMQSGLGLVSMAERINFIGGKFEIISQPGKGTAVTIEIKR